jgi:hypothetical protein
VEERRGERTHGRAPATYPPGLPGRRCAAARCVARPPFFVFLSLLLFFIRTNAQNGWSDAPRRHLPPLPPPPAPPLPRPRKAKTLLPAPRSPLSRRPGQTLAAGVSHSPSCHHHGDALRAPPRRRRGRITRCRRPHQGILIYSADACTLLLLSL